MSQIKRILVVEDNPILLLDLVDQLAALGYDPVPASNAATASRLMDETISALVTDIELGPGPDGLALARVTMRARPCLPVVIVSAGRTPTAAELPPGAVFMPKPCNVRRIQAALERQSFFAAA